MPRLSRLARRPEGRDGLHRAGLARALKAQGKDVVELEIGDSPFPSTPAAKAAGIRGDRGEPDRLRPEPRPPRVPGRRRPVGQRRVRLRGRPRERRGRLGGQAVRAVLRRGPARPGRRRPDLQPALPDLRPQPRTSGGPGGPRRRSGPRTGSGPGPRPSRGSWRPTRSPGPSSSTRPTTRPAAWPPATDLEAIADVVRGTDLMVFSDEPYCHMVWEGRHESIAAEPGMLDHVVAAYTFSKSYSMSGWRIGFAVAHPDVVEAIGKLINTSASCSPPFVQRAGDGGPGAGRRDPRRLHGPIPPARSSGWSRAWPGSTASASRSRRGRSTSSPTSGRSATGWGSPRTGWPSTSWKGPTTGSASPAWAASRSARPAGASSGSAAPSPTSGSTRPWPSSPRPCPGPTGSRGSWTIVPSSGSPSRSRPCLIRPPRRTRRELVPPAKRPPKPKEGHRGRRAARGGQPLGRGGGAPPRARPPMGEDHRRGRPLPAGAPGPTGSARWSGPSSASRSRRRPRRRSTGGSATWPASSTRPGPILAVGEDGLRSCGLSGVKARYILNLAQAVQDGAVPLDEVHAWDDEAIIAALTPIKGVGPWTAEMFLIFALGRPDILSVGDLGHPRRPQELPRPRSSCPAPAMPRADRALAALPDRRHVVSLAADRQPEEEPPGAGRQVGAACSRS